MTIDYDISRLLEAIDRFSEVKLLVLGDVMLDEFIWGTVSRISPEAPVPVVDVMRDTKLLGGSANVINNIISAGGQALLTGVVGCDGPAEKIRHMLEDLAIDPEGIIQDENRPTTVKTRIVAHGQQVVRFDREKRMPVSVEIQNRLYRYISKAAEEAAGVIISDYGKGVVTLPMMEEVRRVFRQKGKIVAVDPKVNNFSLYRDVTVITPNHLEAELGSGLSIDSEETLFSAGWKMLTDLSCDSVLITRGEHGMTLFPKDHSPVNIPTVAREVYDVTGAGDTVIAILTLGLAAGLTVIEAAVLANFAAGIVVGEVGTSTVAADVLKQAVSKGARGLNGLH